MLTKPDQPNYPLPHDFYRMETHAVRRYEDCHYVLMEISPEDYDRTQTKATVTNLRGVPLYYTIRGKQVWLFPIPDREHEITFTYVPPPKEW